MSVPREMVLSRARRTLDELPGLVWPKCTASQRWQVCLVWIKQGGSATIVLGVRVSRALPRSSQRFF